MIRQSMLVAVLPLLFEGCATPGGVPSSQLGKAILAQANGVPAGTAVVTASGDQIRLSIAGRGLPAGRHGLHLHMTGKCEAPGFTSAGAHLNPGGRQH